MRPSPSRLKIGLAAGAAATAAAAGAVALHNRQRARAAEAAHPPQGRFVMVDGIRLHYVDEGRGPVIVMLHGMGALIADLGGSGLIARAAHGHRVIAFDRPGYGYSERPRDRAWTPGAQAALLRQALRALGIDRALVLGHSWGTMVALAFALDYPEATEGLVLLSGYYYPAPRIDPALAGVPAVPVIGPLLANTVSPLIGRAITPRVRAQLFAPGPVPERFRHRFPTGLALRPGQLVAAAGDAAQLQSGAAHLSGRYSALAMPVSLVSGVGDRIVSHADQSARLAAALPQARLHAVPEAGHMIHWVALDTVMAAIDEVARAADAPAPTPA